ncbi:MAG: hypothetical protein EXQ96_10990 [Alphaproteobacteria bacterium]|nr:hypothetical protein [Alphaproteobacteria bacterium]
MFNVSQAAPIAPVYSVGRARNMAWLLAGLLAGTIAATAPASAVVVTWNMCNGDGSANDCEATGVDAPGVDFSVIASPRAETDPAGINNNFFTFTETAEALPRFLVARGFRGDTDAGGASTENILPAEVNIFEGGLGVHWEKDPGKDEDDDSPDHAVDNFDYDELLQFQFADPGYEPLSFRTGWNCQYGISVGEDDDDDDDGDKCSKGGTSDIIAFMGNGDINAAFLEYLQTGTVLAGYTLELFDDVAIGVEQVFENGGTGEFLILAAAAGAHEEVKVTDDNVSPDTSPPKGLSAAEIPELNDDSSSDRKTFCSTTHAAANRAEFGSKKISDTGDGVFKCTWVEVIPDISDNGTIARNTFYSATYAGTRRTNFSSKKVNGDIKTGADDEGTYECKWDEVIPDANDNGTIARNAFCAATYAATGRTSFKAKKISELSGSKNGTDDEGIYRCEWDEFVIEVKDGSNAFKLL